MDENVKLKNTLNGYRNYANSIAFDPNLENKSKTINCITFSFDGNIFATGSDDNTAKLWRFLPNSYFKKATCLNILKGHSNKVMSVVFNPDGIHLATGSLDMTIKLWRFSYDTSIVDCIATLKEHTGGILSLAFNLDGTFLATGSEDNTIKLWHFSQSSWFRKKITCLATLYGHSNYITSVCFSPDGIHLASGSNDNTAKLWGFSKNNFKKEGYCVATLEGNNSIVSSIAFNTDGTFFATGLGNNTVKLWHLSIISSNILKYDCVATLSGHNNIVSSVAFYPFIPLLATGSHDKTVKLWHYLSYQPYKWITNCVATLSGHSNYITSLAFNPKEPFLVTSSNDNTIKLWELNIKELLKPRIYTRNDINNGTQIIIPDKLLKSKNNSSDLYNQIMKIKLPKKFRFIFQEQAGFDIGGLTRNIFEKLLPIYVKRFFESIETNYDFIILKKTENMPKPPKEQDNIWDILVSETEQMIILANAAKTNIFLRIDPRLLKILKSDNYRLYFNNSEQKRKNFKNLYKFFNKNINDIINQNENIRNNTNLTEYFINSPSNYFKNKEEINTLLVKGQFQQLNNSIKREIRLRRFAKECGFSSWRQLNIMYNFINKLWNDKIFIDKLKFDIESFVKRINIIEIKIVGHEITSNGLSMPIYSEFKISLDDFGKLSEDRKNFVFNQEFKPEIIDLFTKYYLFLPMLQFIFGSESTDENRKIFLKNVSGSIYYPGELLIKLSTANAKEMKKPFKSTTCFFYIELYKSSSNKNNENLKNIMNSIKVQLEQNINDFKYV